MPAPHREDCCPPQVVCGMRTSGKAFVHWEFRPGNACCRAVCNHHLQSRTRLGPAACAGLKDQGWSVDCTSYRVCKDWLDLEILLLGITLAVNLTQNCRLGQAGVTMKVHGKHFLRGPTQILVGSSVPVLLCKLVPEYVC